MNLFNRSTVQAKYQHHEEKLCQKIREKCPYSAFFWSVFSRIQTEYRKMLCISPYSVRMQENTDQKNCEYEHCSYSEKWTIFLTIVPSLIPVY